MKLFRLVAAHLCLCCVLLTVCVASSEFLFSDDRFRGNMTTDNLDAIINEYELFGGWYWTTRSGVVQTFHGCPDSPGWTSSAEASGRKDYLKGWYGCRWPVNSVMETAPGRGGYAECFGFAQFIGYLLSGEINPQGNWDFYYSVEASGGLRVGDIVRSEYTKKGHFYQHSAVVYAINGEEILFLQVSGSACNRISVGRGFRGVSATEADSLEEISDLHWLKISRYNPPE